MIVLNLCKTNRFFEKKRSNSNHRLVQIMEERINRIRQKIYTSSSQPPRLCPILDKPPSSTYFNKL